MDKLKKVAVVIPFYKDKLSAYESIALQQCFKILSANPIIAVKPQKLVLPDEVKEHAFFNTIAFADEYFENVEGYNRLMLDDLFYKEFLAYEYILIYQLDAFVFKDDLNYWCNQGLDYIGAPWIRSKPYPDIVKAVKSKVQNYFHTRYNLQKDGLPTDKQFDYKVGNGGFSLRKTRAFYDICITQRVKIRFYNSIEHHGYNEDVFWSIEVNRKRKILKIPPYKKALKFSVEFYPQRAFVLNHDQLPFGCHAWDINIDFWRPIFEQHGYII